MALSVEDEIIQVQQQITNLEEKHDSEIQELQREITDLENQLKTKAELPVPQEIEQLREQLQKFNEEVSSKAKTSVEYFKDKQIKQNEKQEEASMQKMSTQKTEYTTHFYNELVSEERELQKQLQDEEKKYIDLEEAVKNQTAEEKELKRELVYRKLSESSSSDVFDQTKMVENLQQEEKTVSKSSVRTKTTNFSTRTKGSFLSAEGVIKPINIHALCQRKLQITKNRILVLKQSIASLKLEFEPILEEIERALRDNGLLENFLENGEFALSLDEKEELAAILASNEPFVENLTRIALNSSIKGLTDKNMKEGNYI